MPIVGSAWFSVGTSLFSCVLNYVPDAYPKYAASVLAGKDFMRSSFGAGFPLFATAMYNNPGVDWASSTLAFLSSAFIPIPFVLYWLSFQAIPQRHGVLTLHYVVRRKVTEDEQACQKRLLSARYWLLPLGRSFPGLNSIAAYYSSDWRIVTFNGIPEYGGRYHLHDG